MVTTTESLLSAVTSASRALAALGARPEGYAPHGPHAMGTKALMDARIAARKGGCKSKDITSAMLG